MTTNFGEAVQAVGDGILENKIEHGWPITTREKWRDEPDHVPSILALIHSEVSEALEAYRKGDFANFSEELADVGIRLIGLAHGLEIDLGGEILRKMEKNKSRSFRHGGKRI